MTEESAPRPFRLLYVGGLGRSGSTLLERALAQFPGVCGVGEVVYLWQRGIIDDQLCGCGVPFSECEFWSAVGLRAFGGWDRVDTARVRELAERVDDVRRVPRLFLPPRGRELRADLAEYLRYYESLYAAVAEISGCDVIVDSSKVTSLAYVLSHSRRLSMRMVHILRDPRAVAHAWTKSVRRPDVVGTAAYMRRYSPRYMALLFTGHHALLEALRLRRVRSARVRYEDFADDPIAELTRIADFAGLDLPSARLRGDVDSSLRLGPVHTVSGNPSRFDTGDVVVRRDEAWRSAMPRRQKAVVSAIALPALLAYGYPVRPPAPLSASPLLPSADATPRPVRSWPSVTVVVPTHDRPELVRRALASVAVQDYPGHLETIVVFDRCQPDSSLASTAARRSVRVLANDRTPGLAGARNTGILAADTDLVAFLDDDDHWLSAKLTRQVERLLAEPDAEFATTAMTIDYEERSIDRTAGTPSVQHRDLLRSRMAMLHSSSFLARRSALLSGIGLVDETIPQSMAEDWDLLLRASARQPIAHLDEPLIRVQWGPTSYFADQWSTRNAARLWMLEHHPDIATDPRAGALTYGKLAFGCAMLGQPRASLGWVRKTWRNDWREPRAVLALLVTARLLSGPWIVDQLNRRGHGI